MTLTEARERRALSQSCFHVTRDKGIAEIRLDRPDALNTMTQGFWNDLPGMVTELDRDGGVRVILLTSTGKHFSAGMDLNVFADPKSGLNALGAMEEGRKRLAMRDLVKALQRSFSCLAEARVPVIAAIQGGCIGGAVDMVSACDIRYCTEDAFFSIEETKIGMTADVGTFPRLCRLIPDGWVREMAYTGRRLPAATAREIGLVNAVYPGHDSLLVGVRELAAEIAARSPLAVTGCKTMINYARDHSDADTLDYMATWQAGMFQPADMRESFAAKGEKRPPDYPDLPARTEKL